MNLKSSSHLHKCLSQCTQVTEPAQVFSRKLRNVIGTHSLVESSITQQLKKLLKSIALLLKNANGLLLRLNIIRCGMD